MCLRSTLTMAIVLLSGCTTGIDPENPPASGCGDTLGGAVFGTCQDENSFTEFAQFSGARGLVPGGIQEDILDFLEGVSDPNASEAVSDLFASTAQPPGSLTIGSILQSVGRAVDISGEVAVVGALIDDDSSPFLEDTFGEAYVLSVGGASLDQEARLLSSNRHQRDNFGVSVAVDGDVILIGASADNPEFDGNFGGPGAAYVFRSDGSEWSQDARLEPLDGHGGFGRTVAVDAGVAVIGARQIIFGNSSPPGVAYVFRHVGTEWSREDFLQAPTPSDGDDFGGAVALEGNVMVVGARWSDVVGFQSGSAYVYRFNGSTWDLEAELRPFEGDNSQFGTSVAIDGNRVFVGSPGFGTDEGSAYLFAFDGAEWRFVTELRATDPDSCASSVGSSVDILGDVALLGAATACQGGAAYVFRFDGTNWNQTRRLLASDANFANLPVLGQSVALSDRVAIVGGPSTVNGNGAAYFFSVER